MDEYTLNGAMTVLYLAKLMEEHGRLEKFYKVAGCDDLSLDYDGQYLAELAAYCALRWGRLACQPRMVFMR